MTKKKIETDENLVGGSSVRDDVKRDRKLVALDRHVAKPDRALRVLIAADAAELHGVILVDEICEAAAIHVIARDQRLGGS